jgi:hypothetical protein
MPVPTVLADLSTTLSNNSPPGTETVGTNLDDYLRAGFGLLAQVNANKLETSTASSTYAPIASPTFTGTVTGTFSGSGASLTALNATQLTSGTVPSARVAGAYTAVTAIGNTTSAVSFAAAGNVTVAAPSSGNTLTLGAPAAATSLVVLNTAGNNAIATSDGTCQTAIYTNGASGALFSVATNHPLSFRTNNTARIDIAAAGEVTLNASTGGNKHLVNQQGGSFAIGYLNLPQSASTTAATTDVGKSIVATSTITIPNSTFAAGDCFTIYNNSAAAITLTCNTTTTRIAGTATTGTTRTLALRGQCTAYFLSATELILSGNVT